MSSPTDQATQRRLAAVLAADVVGYSGLMSKDEEGTLVRLRDLRRQVIEPGIQAHRGRLVKTVGDGFLVEFASPLAAVRCAVDLQEAVAAASDEPVKPFKLRIGINLGDIMIEEDGDIFGDGVNIASRLEQMSPPGGICLSGKVYEEVRDKLPYTFEDQGEHQFKNIGRPIRVYCILLSADAAVAAGGRKLAAPAMDRPSIAVLPFVNLSKDPEQEYFADGIVEDIISALSRFRSFLVIARNTTFTYKGRSVNVPQIGRELGVRYVLEGSVRRSGDRIRITAQLIDAATGMHMWAEHYDGVVADVFDLQDQITASVVGSIEPLDPRRRDRAGKAQASRQPRCLRPRYACAALCLVARIRRQLRSDEAARGGYAPRSRLSIGLSLAAGGGQRIIYNWSRICRKRSADIAPCAGCRSPDHDDPFILTVLARLSRSRTNSSVPRRCSIGHCSLDPELGLGLEPERYVARLSDDPRKPPIDQFERSLRLSPFDPMAFNCEVGIGGAHFIARRYEAAAQWMERP